MKRRGELTAKKQNPRFKQFNLKTRYHPAARSSSATRVRRARASYRNRDHHLAASIPPSVSALPRMQSFASIIVIDRQSLLSHPFENRRHNPTHRIYFRYCRTTGSFDRRFSDRLFHVQRGTCNGLNRPQSLYVNSIAYLSHIAQIKVSPHTPFVAPKRPCARTSINRWQARRLVPDKHANSPRNPRLAKHCMRASMLSRFYGSTRDRVTFPIRTRRRVAERIRSGDHPSLRRRAHFGLEILENPESRGGRVNHLAT